MTWIFEIVIANTAIAAALALVIVLLAWHFRRNPALVHALWVVVLLKLITPPLLGVPLPFLESIDSTSLVSSIDEFGLQGSSIAMASSQTNGNQGAWGGFVGLLTGSVGLVWLVGSLVWVSIAAVRIRCFSRVLQQTKLCDGRVRRVADQAAESLGMAKSPLVVMTEACLPPMVWHMGRFAKVVIPEQLVSSVDDEKLRGILTHEFAHIRRGDHWLRWLSLFVLAIYWWNPIAWWAVHRMRVAEEQCCDAMVISAASCERKAYAQTLLETLDFLDTGRPALPLLASRIDSGGSMKKRFEMILHGCVNGCLGVRVGVFVVLGAALLLGTTVVRGDQPDDRHHLQHQAVEKTQELVEFILNNEADGKEKAKGLQQVAVLLLRPDPNVSVNAFTEDVFVVSQADPSQAEAEIHQDRLISGKDVAKEKIQSTMKQLEREVFEKVQQLDALAVQLKELQASESMLEQKYKGESRE